MEVGRLGGPFDGFPAGWKNEVMAEVFGTSSIAKNDAILFQNYGDLATGINQLINQPTARDKYATSCSYSKDGKYLFTDNNSSSNCTLCYQINGDTYTLVDTNLKSGNYGRNVYFSPNGKYMGFVRSGASTYAQMAIYNGTPNVSTYCTIPTIGAGCEDFTSDYDASYVAFGSSGAYLMRRTDETNFSTILTLSSTDIGTAYGVALTNDGNYFAVGGSKTPYIKWYKKTGASTFTALSSPATIPSVAIKSCCWSDDGTYLAISLLSTGIWIYKRNGDTLTKIANPSYMPKSPTYMKFDATGTYLCCCTTTEGTIFYKRNGDTFTLMYSVQDMVISPGIDISPDGKHIAIASTREPFLAVYRAEAKNIALKNTVNNLPYFSLSNRQWGVALDGGGIGATIKVNTFPKTTLT